MLAGAARGGDQIDLSWPVLQTPRTEAPIVTAAALSFGTTLVVDPTIEARAPVGFDARALVVEHEAEWIGRPRAVDDVGDAGELIQLGCETLHFGVGVARGGRGGIIPPAHRVEAQRVRLVADYLRDPVLLADKQRPELARQRDELGLFPVGDIDECDGETVSIRAVQ